MGRDVYRFEGVRALFKGLGPTLSGVVPARYPFQLRDFFFLLIFFLKKNIHS